MLKRGQVEHVKAERNVLAEVHNPYVVKLFYSFQVSECTTEGVFICSICESQAQTSFLSLFAINLHKGIIA